MYNQISSNKRKSFFLIAGFILFIAGLGYFYDLYFGAAAGSGLIFASVFSLVSVSISYFAGDKMALAASGAKPVSREQNSYLYRLIENLSITAGLPLPKIHIISDQAINAFATGRDPKHASIAVTTGALEKLTNEELEGVLAHELSHIKNYDIRWMMLVIILVGTVSLLSQWSFRARLFGGGERRRQEGPGGQLQALFMIIGFILILLSPLIAELIKLAVSRRREYLADASGVLLTRYPAGLANALEKIAKQARPLLRASSATAPLFIANPLVGSKLANLFSTHPPLADRIKILRNMA